MKQVLATYINHYRIGLLEGTSTGVIIMRNHVRDPHEVRAHDPEVARHTPYPLGHRSPMCNYQINPPIYSQIVCDNNCYLYSDID